jgi:hypothetical protein
MSQESQQHQVGESMLHHETTGPDTAGEFHVTYKTPGCDVPTVVCSGIRSRSAADGEAERRNSAQLAHEKALQADALARGLPGVYPGLEQPTA